MQKASVFTNYLYSLSYQLLLLVVPLVTMPYLASTIGITNQGTFEVGFSVVSIFVLLGCIGLNVYGQREIAYYKDDAKKCNSVFWEIELIRVITLSVALAIYFIFAVVNINVYQMVSIKEKLYFLLFALEILASMLDISWYYQGIENFKLQTVRNFLVKLINLALILIFVKDENDLGLYIFIYCSMNVVGNATLWLDKVKHGGFVKPRKKCFKPHITKSLLMFLPQVATTVYVYVDKVMLGVLVADGNFQVGIYGNAEKIVKVALTVVTSLGLVMLSRVANTYKQNDKQKTNAYIRESFNLYIFLAVPIMFGIMAIADTFVIRFFGGADGFEQITPVMVLLCPIILFIGGSNVFGTQYLLPTNRMTPYTLSVFVGMAVNVVLNLCLIPHFNAMGAAFATVAAEFAVLLVQMVAVRRDFTVVLYLKCWRNFLAGVVMFFAVFVLHKFVGDSLAALFVQVCFGAVIYFVVLLLLADPFVKKYLNKLKQKMGM